MAQLRPYIEPDEPEHQSNDLLPFTADRNGRERWVDIRALVEEVLDMLTQQMRTQRIHVELDVPHAQRIWVDDTSLRRCVWHLALNALDAMPKGGELTITSYVGAHGFELEVADSGRGISDDFRRRITDPEVQSGDVCIAHGLMAALRLASVQGGEVAACNCPEGGAAFTIRLPNRQMQAAA